MLDQSSLSWATLVALGAFHGVNPGMGWLFAVALGMQERRRAAVWQALLPLATGHALAVAATMALAILAGAVVPLQYLRWLVAVVLIVFAASCLLRHRHPRWASMNVGMGRLTLWSFLMASAHGAGLMVVPVFLGMSMAAGHHSGHAMLGFGDGTTALLATAVHAAGYLLVTGLIAILVFEKLGLAMLRKAWFNLDLLWAIALGGTGLMTLLV